jgi:transposase
MKMTKKYRQYSREFKLDAIHLADTSGKTIVEIENDLGLSRGTLNRWKKEAREEGNDAFPGSGHHFGRLSTGFAQQKP